MVSTWEVRYWLGKNSGLNNFGLLMVAATFFTPWPYQLAPFVLFILSGLLFRR